MKVFKSIFVIGLVFMVSIALAGEVKIPNTNISINAPQGWTADTAPPRGQLIVLSSEPLQGFKATINLATDDLGGQTPQAWLAEYKNGLSQNIGEFYIVKEGERKLGGAPYYAIEFRGKQGAVMIHWLQVIHFQEGKAWIFSANSMERYVSIYMPVFQKAFSSIFFPPPPPENVNAQVLSPTQVILTWSAQPLAQGGYEIQRRDAMMGVWQTITKVPENTTTYTDSTIGCGTEVRYRIKCLNPKGDSNWSAEVPAVLGVCSAATGEQPVPNK